MVGGVIHGFALSAGQPILGWRSVSDDPRQQFVDPVNRMPCGDPGQRIT
jgi:hypothetical protein